MSETLFIDAVVITLLGATIYFAFRLDRRLQGMRSVQSELANVIRELNAAAAQAEAGIQGLRLAAESSGRQLDERIKNAKGIGEELAILMRASERAVHQIEPSRAQPISMKRTQSRPALDALRALGATG